MRSHSILTRPERLRSQRRALMFTLAAKFGWICWYCNLQLKPPSDEAGVAAVIHTHNSPVPHLDHIVPVSAGGGDEPSNRALACAMCNMAKGALLAEEFIEWLDRIRFSPTWSPIKTVLGIEYPDKQG